MDGNQGRRRRGAGLWILLALLLGFVLGSLFGGAITSMLGLSANNLTGNKAQNTPGNQAATKEHAHGDESLADRLEGVEGSSQLYAQRLGEAMRESTDAPSAEATAAQDSLTDATNELAEAISQKTATTGDNAPTQNELTDKLRALNTAMLQYTAAAVNEDEASEDAVNTAVSDLSRHLKSQYRSQQADKTSALLNSFKNSYFEGSRNFVDENFATSYDKFLQGERDFMAAMTNLQSK